MRRLAALVVALVPQAVAASPQDLFGYGAVAPAMGATGATFIDDYAAVHANPAGLSRAHARAITLGYAGTAFDLTLGGQHARGDAGRATLIGLTLPLPLGGVLRDRLALGLGFFTPTNVVVRGRILRPETPQFIALTDRVQSVAVQLGAGVDLGHGLRVGGGFAALAGLTGTVVVATDATGRVGSRIDDQLVASYAPIAGASFERGPFRFAAVLRGSLVARFLVTIEARDLGVTIPRLNISGVAQYDPAQLHVEGGYVRGPWTLALAATVKQWSDYPGPSEATTEGSPAPPPPDFHDTVVVRAGAERRWTWGLRQLALRVGYFFEPSPAPPATASRRYLDNDRHAFTGGVGFASTVADTRVTADFFAQYHLLSAREAEAPLGSHGGTVLFAGMTASLTF